MGRDVGLIAVNLRSEIMGSTYGTWCKVSIWGQSHGPAVGVTIDGLPAGHVVNLNKVQEFMNRRAPGQSLSASARVESDQVKILSGLYEGKTCGAPLMVLIDNEDVHTEDYNHLRNVPRPGHADLGAYYKYGSSRSIAGGGHYSGRLTASMCAAGAIMMGYIEELGITVSAKATRIGDKTNPDNFQEEILNAKEENDSVGGVIECTVNGLLPGIGEPIFEGIENQIAQVIFGVPGVKGIEFGAGFEGTRLRGSKYNDAYRMDQGQVKAMSNNNGGAIGGMSNGMPLVFRVAIKPTASIGREQKSINLMTMENTTVTIKGRHDPCIVPRAIPCIEAATAIALFDLLGRNSIWKAQGNEDKN